MRENKNDVGVVHLHNADIVLLKPVKVLRRFRLSHREFCRAFLVNADKLTFLTFVFEFNKAFDQRKERIVFTAPDVFARFPFRAALSRQNVAAENVFAAEFF